MDLPYCKGGRQGAAYFAADGFGLPSSEPSRWFVLAHEHIMESDPTDCGPAALRFKRSAEIIRKFVS